MLVILNYFYWFICKKKNILYIFIFIKLILRVEEREREVVYYYIFFGYSNLIGIVFKLFG